MGLHGPGCISRGLRHHWYSGVCRLHLSMDGATITEVSAVRVNVRAFLHCQKNSSPMCHVDRKCWKPHMCGTSALVL